MLTPGKYYSGGTISVTAAFVDTNGLPADPVTVAFKTVSPCGECGTYIYGTDANVTKVSTGNYAAALTPKESGRWFTRWEGTDVTGNVAAIEDFFSIQRSKFNRCCPDYTGYGWYC